MSIGTPSRRILFVSHSASMNGASILLLHTLRWLKENTAHDLHVLCLGRGPILDEYRAVARTHVLRDLTRVLPTCPTALTEPICRTLDSAIMRWLLKRWRFDLVYANTAAVWRQVAAAARTQVPVLWHVHELPHVLNLTLGATKARPALSQTRHFIAVSGAVADTLSESYSVPAKRIDVIHGFVSTDSTTEVQRSAARSRVLTALGWPPDAFVVGGCGGLGWRKGTDLFAQIAARCRALGGERPIRFLWIGGSHSEVDALQLSHDIARLGLNGDCRHVAATHEVLDYYQAMDIFALTSREDPFPLVMLEAGIRGVPTVCFQDSGGGSEFVAGEVGVAVPYLDVSAFADALLALRDQPERLLHMQQTVRRKTSLGYTVDRQAPKLLASIERCIDALDESSPYKGTVEGAVLASNCVEEASARHQERHLSVKAGP
jgi:glycosyltransferase involved in cell wall biosynthesis